MSRKFSQEEGKKGKRPLLLSLEKCGVTRRGKKDIFVSKEKRRPGGGNFSLICPRKGGNGCGKKQTLTSGDPSQRGKRRGKSYSSLYKRKK